MLTVITRKFSPWLTVLLLSLLCIVLPHWHGSASLLAYQRSSISDGAWWQLLTGNLLHTNGWHLAMNLAGFWVVAFIHRIHYHNGQLALLMLALLLLEGVGLWFAYPMLLGYVGLSGVLHGLFTYGALADIAIGWRSGYLLLAGVIAKVSWEQLMGASNEVTQLIGARVATEAHLIGLLSGMLLFAVARAIHAVKKAHSNTHQ